MLSPQVSRRWVLRTATGTAVGGFLIAAGAPAPARADTVTCLRLPAPTRPERIGTVALHLIDHARHDPWVPTRAVRELIVQIWYPARRHSGQPVAAWQTRNAIAHFEQARGLPAGVLRWPDTHARWGVPVRTVHSGWPVVLYSHGLDLNRALGTLLVEELVSHGYVVVTIDHTHDASEVEFPGGRVEVRLAPGDDENELLTRALQVRTADTRFVLDRLAALNAGHNPDAGRRPLPVGLHGEPMSFHAGVGLIGYGRT